MTEVVPRVLVQHEAFDVAAEMAALPGQDTHGIGGIGCFVGVVRADAGAAQAPLAALTLEHYPGMTERALREIAEAAIARFGLQACTVIHRVGRLAPGAPIVLVLAAASHRKVSLDATAFLIDWLKTRAPFWKREDRTDGSSAWVEARLADEDAASGWDAASPGAA